ncbi:MAG: hypothetical protein PWP12_730 [Bacillota bacterium]|jgi:LysM repeat protein/proteasome lid subunit RPN8/RPN11|nr:hypothetical protein [Bacillota bacterium]MDK2883135.1 hypothetical protein [Bacillota bacterium]MDK2960546.1 hypothetical protein [Bacillota bacterium]
MPVGVHIARTVKSEILAWARQAEGREIGGLLLGRVRGDGERALVRVEAALLARGADSVGSSIRFTPELMAELSARGKKKYPAFRIVGWFHTHKGLGAFLSGYDTAVHKEHFPEPWQVALVLDTELEREALYVRQGTEMVPVHPYASGSLDSAPSMPGTACTRYRLARPGRLFGVLLVVTLALAVALAGRAWWTRRHVPGAEVQTPVPAQSTARGTVPAAGEAADEAPSDNSSSAGQEQGAPPGQRYIIRPGDTLWGISERFYGDGSFYSEISRLNRLSNPRLLYPGDEIILPEKETKTEASSQ